ncbi:YafY family protein [Paenibacillus sp. N3.4]|uniref:helix-turn-helix transcriptional regulator n=1 Tax=Paenibacillus sp. N3.4 TaxID=2603222 RepID=UPI0011C7CA62|nr:WYL domain-containing protein [Paenibacillus sp. N3.4]TXK71766.1 WYL domain-containing protein [Paenibacillus sp. N3.4]
MVKEKDRKSNRLLTIFERLNKGELLIKKDLAKEMLVDVKTIQRDFDEIRVYFAERLGDSGFLDLKYDSKKKGYILVSKNEYFLNSEEITVISKILLESRALNKIELEEILDKLILQSTPSERKFIREIVNNERFHYLPLQHNSFLISKVWNLSAVIRSKKLLKITYMRVDKELAVERVVKPVGIIFSDYYFYLTAYIADRSDSFPTIYRLDRITDYIPLAESFYIPEAERFEEGEFRKKIQFMYSGELMSIQFKFWGPSLEAVLDRLPTARIVGEVDNKKIIEAEVFGEGVKMWLLSQGAHLEIIKPEKLRNDFMNSLNAIIQMWLLSQGAHLEIIKPEKLRNDFMNSLNAIIQIYNHN